ncbi:hypothetical protein BDP27DRAFT_201883 [Rhodocollybia butyracea]|uniref:Uncharacterized protein n=1 Tax=Rhodocollybia butyracea TaxID=206335 RepID=A0A9P5PIL6_9AGAR|nr:hypothetical protein BDP27DRAFT_201883 [Rhodocollybia butyracea]
MLYHADNLGSGNHTVVFTNWANGTTPTVVVRQFPSGGVSVRQADSEAQVTFGMHQAKVWKAAVTSASISPQKTSLGTGAIAAISLGSVVFLSLVALLLLLNRRNKNLWALLHKGYKVQSQFDPDSPRPRSKDLEAASPNPPPSARAISFLLPSSKKLKNQSIEPYLLTTGGPILKTETSTHKRNRTEGSGGSGLYKPYAEFGKSRTKNHDSLESVSHGADDADGDDRTGRLEHRPSPLPLPDPSEREIDAREPLRSDTLMTASTLIAEDGSEDDTASILDDKPLLKVLPEWHPTLAVHNNAKTPTESTASTRGTFPPSQTPSLVSSPKFSSIISAVRRSSRMSYASHFSRTRKRQTRSASPSQRHLLRPSGTEAHSDSEDYDEMDYEGADFYAQDAQGAVGVVRSSLMSLAATQWDAQTPIRGRSHDEEYDEASDFSRIQLPPLDPCNSF